MKRSALLTLFTACLLLSGCTNTIKGIQEDTGEAWHGTKQVIHEATADD